MAVLAVFLLKGTDTFAQQTDPTLTVLSLHRHPH